MKSAVSAEQDSPRQSEIALQFCRRESWWGFRSPRPRSRAFGACWFAALTAWLCHEKNRKHNSMFNSYDCAILFDSVR